MTNEEDIDGLTLKEYQRRVNVYHGLDSGRVCATPRCFDEPDSLAVFCPACLREQTMPSRIKWSPSMESPNEGLETDCREPD